MGSGSFIRNRHSGKSYAVSTIRHPILGVSETIVVEVVGTRLFGLFPKVGRRALLGVHTQSESDANEVHSFVTTLVESTPESEWNAHAAGLAQRAEVLRVHYYPEAEPEARIADARGYLERGDPAVQRGSGAKDDHRATLSGLPDWVRWVLVLPSGFAGFFLIQVVVILVGLVNSALQGFSIPDWLYQLINSLASGWAFVRAAAWMAPRANVVVAMVHAVIFSILTTFISVLSLTQPNPGFLLFAAVLGLIGGIAACVQIYNYHGKAPTDEELRSDRNFVAGLNAEAERSAKEYGPILRILAEAQELGKAGGFEAALKRYDDAVDALSKAMSLTEGEQSGAWSTIRLGKAMCFRGLGLHQEARELLRSVEGVKFFSATAFAVEAGTTRWPASSRARRFTHLLGHYPRAVALPRMRSQ